MNNSLHYLIRDLYLNNTIAFNLNSMTDTKSGLTKIKDEEEDKIREAFQYLDTDGDGFIDEYDLAKASKSVGVELEQEQILELI